MITKKPPKKESFLLEEKPIKKPYQVDTYTPHQIQELKKCATDIFYFIENYVYVVHPIRGHCQFKLYDYQKEIIQNLLDNKNNCLFVSRQMGKSACVVVYALWLVLFKGQQTALFVSNVKEAAIENIDRFRYSYESLPNWLKPGVLIDNRGSLFFDNKSRVVCRATTKNSGRGLSPSFVFVDELAAVEPRKQREFWSALSPTLSTGGQCAIASTPNNDEDVFAQIVQGAGDIFDEFGIERENGLGRNGFKLLKYIWSDNPERDEIWEKEQRAKDGDEFFEREHSCRFISFDATLINPFVLAKLKGKDPSFMQGTVRWYSTPQANKTYLMSLDPSMGSTNGDPAAIQVFQLPEMLQVAEWCHNKTDLPGQARLFRDIGIYIVECQKEQGQNKDVSLYWTIENNSVGEAINVIINEIGEQNFAGEYLSDKSSGKIRRKGFCMTNKLKVQMCARFKTLVEKSKITINSKALISQLKTFVSSGASFKGKSNEPDDLVMSCLLIVKLLERVMNFDDVIKDTFRESIEGGEEKKPLWFVF